MDLLVGAVGNDALEALVEALAKLLVALLDGKAVVVGRKDHRRFSQIHGLGGLLHEEVLVDGLVVDHGVAALEADFHEGFGGAVEGAHRHAGKLRGVQRTGAADFSAKRLVMQILVALDLFFFRQEIRRREENRFRQGIMGAHFPAVRTLEDFDFEAQPSIDVKQIKELAQLEWIGQAKNVLFLGSPVVGKTHLPIALGREAIKQGMSVAFYSAEELGSLLDRALKEGTIKQKLYQLSKPKLLVLDEFVYTPFSSASAPLLFRLINSRYEQKSILITNNKPVSEWAGVLGDATLTTAMLDRLLHHSEIIMIRGDSYRLLEKRKEGLLTSARAVGTALTD